MSRFLALALALALLPRLASADSTLSQADRVVIDKSERSLTLYAGERRLGRDFAASGYPAAMKALYRKTLAFLEEAGKYAYVSPVHFAVLHAQLGQNDEAFAWLEKAFEERQPWLGQLKVDPQFEPLRSDPRFGQLIRRVEETGARERLSNAA